MTTFVDLRRLSARGGSHRYIIYRAPVTPIVLSRNAFKQRLPQQHHSQQQVHETSRHPRVSTTPAAAPRKATKTRAATLIVARAMASRALAPKATPKWFVGKDPLGDGLVEDPPTRSKTGEFIFNDAPDFKPNLSPQEVLQAGSFGGGYFRDITSSVTKTTYKDAWKELPDDWLEGLDIKTQVASQTYRTSINRYGVNCGVKTDKSDSFGLKAWESSGWMAAQDPYGWFQWYCRFFSGSTVG